MDIVFDIDGTLANAEHRLHHIIEDPNRLYEGGFKKDWDRFLSDELVAQDTSIPQTWKVLCDMIRRDNRIIFITGRPEAQYEVTQAWLNNKDCLHRALAWAHWHTTKTRPVIYMRTDGDRRPSHIVKREGLIRARQDGYDPKLVFEDRIDDTAMWRSEGLLCCQVAEGNY